MGYCIVQTSGRATHLFGHENKLAYTQPQSKLKKYEISSQGFLIVYHFKIKSENCAFEVMSPRWRLLDTVDTVCLLIFSFMSTLCITSLYIVSLLGSFIVKNFVTSGLEKVLLDKHYCTGGWGLQEGHNSLTFSANVCCSKAGEKITNMYVRAQREARKRTQRTVEINISLVKYAHPNLEG